jgi:farnesyl diphosphate synthase
MPRRAWVKPCATACSTAASACARCWCWRPARPCRGLRPAALRAAVAVELIHAYSLVHDDMPCMDNDVLRRGKPTVHVQVRRGPGHAGRRCDAGTGLRVLTSPVVASAGDATSAVFDVEPVLQARLCSLLARAAGHAGMAGGQAIDLASVGRPLDEATLRDMHRRKTGALLQGSVLMGAACGTPGALAWQRCPTTAPRSAWPSRSSTTSST